MATDSVKECVLCNNEFDEDQRSPRNLICGHCFCTFCINQLIVRKEKKCPLCRKGFEAISAQEFVINNTALDLLKYVKDIEERAPRGSEMSRSAMVNMMKHETCEMHMKNILICKQAIAQIKVIKEKTLELIGSITRNQVKLKHDKNNMYNIKEFEALHKIMLQFLLRKTEKLDNLMTEAEEKQQKLEEVKVFLGRANTLVKVDSALDKAEVSNTYMKSWLLKLKTGLTRDEEIHQVILKVCQSCCSMKPNEEKLNSMKENDEGVLRYMAAIAFQEENPTQITPEILQRMSATTRFLVSLGGIYAVQVEEGKTRYGRLSLSENKLCLHHLTETQLPPDTCTVQFDDVMKLVHPFSRLTFLELESNERKLCRVYIRLTPDTKRAQNFTLMSTGEKGPTYVGTSFEGICEDKQQNYIYSGYCIAEALIQGSGGEKGGLLTRKEVVGSVGGWYHEGDPKASMFYIITKVKTPPALSPAIFGMVESGIDVLAEANSLYPKMTKDVKVGDCGIVLIE